MEDGKQFSLRWDKHAVNLASEAECFFQDEAFLDCTLFAEGQCLQAHKIILSAASPYLANLLRAAHDKHPILIFNDIKFEDLKGIVSFIYNGHVSIPEVSMGAFLHAAQALLVRGLTQGGTQWQPEGSADAAKASLVSGRRNSKHGGVKQRPAQSHPSSSSPPRDDPHKRLRPLLPAPFVSPPTPAPQPQLTTEDNACKLQEVSMSNYLPSTRRYTKAVTQNANFVMSSWKLGAYPAEDKNGHRKSTEENCDSQPAHLFKKFRLEKPMPSDEEKTVTVKQESEEEALEMDYVEPKVEVELEEEENSISESRDSYYQSSDESPVPLLVCKTSLQEESDGCWSGANVAPEMNQLEPGQELPCQRCHKRYKSRYALNRHVLYECGKARKSFSCDECGKKVTRQDTLQKHKLIHLVQHMKEKDEAI